MDCCLFKLAGEDDVAAVSSSCGAFLAFLVGEAPPRGVAGAEALPFPTDPASAPDLRLRDASALASGGHSSAAAFDEDDLKEDGNARPDDDEDEEEDEEERSVRVRFGPAVPRGCKVDEEEEEEEEGEGLEECWRSSWCARRR